MIEIDAHVAAVLPPHRVALNVGSAQHVEAGAHVTVYRSVDVKDPVTAEPLGTVRVPKLGLRVESVQERLCVARVADRVESTDLFKGLMASQPPLKKVVEDQWDESATAVHVAPGDSAVVKVYSEDEVPF